jgi:hypothetical protein
MSFWTGASTIAGALRRKTWIDQVNFKWFPNMYVIFVAPPGIVQKSTTINIGMSMLREVPGIHFGPDIVTWQSLVCDLEGTSETFELEGDFYTHSSMTIESSELGNILDVRDKAMVNLFISLYDGKQGDFSKHTKNSGNNKIENPWINFIACTTPSWIADNFTEGMVSGGFTSRCLFIYADKKAQLRAYLKRAVPKGHSEMRKKLVEDLMEIATSIAGEYALTEEAMDWGEVWYEKLWSVRPVNLDDDRFAGYIARKQAHIHKLAMVIAASADNKLEITSEHLSTADTMITDLEPDMARVFSKLGKSDFSFYADRLIQHIHKSGTITYQEAYRYVHTQFPSVRDFEDVLAGLVRAGFVRMGSKGGEVTVEAMV